MIKLYLSTATLILILIVSGAMSLNLADGFTRKYIRKCLSSKFTRQLQVNGEATKFTCASVCAGFGANCQGFELIKGVKDKAMCQGFIFDRCSHMVNTEQCDQFGWAYVRNRPGLLDGRLCPDGFHNSYFGSVYQLVSAANWTDGRQKCETMPGLTKFADAIDRNETLQFIRMRDNIFSNQKFYVGGWRPGKAISDPWFWYTCNSTCYANMWEPGEGASGAEDRLLLWIGRQHGFDDVADANLYPNISKALCECVDPFQ